MDSKIIASAIAMAVLVMAVPVASFDGIDSYAATGDGDRYAVTLVEGESYSYTPEYTIDGVTTTVSGVQWLSCDGGVISGTAPSVDAGSSERFDLTVKAVSQNPYQEAYQYIQFTVYDRLEVSGEGSVDTFIGGDVDVRPVCAYGSGVSWSISGAPEGVVIDKATGVISGTVGGTKGMYEATVTATHAASGQTATHGITFDVAGTLSVTSGRDVYMVNGAALPTSFDDPNYYRLTASLDGVTWKLSEGSVTGISIGTDGTISGTPTAMGDHEVTVTATHAASGQTADFVLNVHISAKLSFSTSPTGGIIVEGA